MVLKWRQHGLPKNQYLFTILLHGVISQRTWIFRSLFMWLCRFDSNFAVLHLWTTEVNLSCPDLPDHCIVTDSTWATEALNVWSFLFVVECRWSQCTCEIYSIAILLQSMSRENCHWKFYNKYIMPVVLYESTVCRIVKKYDWQIQGTHVPKNFFSCWCFKVGCQKPHLTRH
jgi:hypothetical protein